MEAEGFSELPLVIVSQFQKMCARSDGTTASKLEENSRACALAWLGIRDLWG